ncbi:MAG: penicillin-binding protein activator LpoB [Treponema sp.]|jgi:PBP1b-binding outer membrane lipoprotein LpoB|nr:penicillin-binding protein activator LpoB [Treponema sp.]
MKKFILFAVFTAPVFCMLSCGSAPSVSRVSSNSLTDLSGRWNNTDVRIVCTSLIDSCLNSSRIARFAGENDRLPRIKIGTFKNNTDEHLDPTIIPNAMKVVITNSGRAEFVADSATQNELRAEKQDQLGAASYETAASVGNETAADFMLTGSVKTIVDRAGLTSTRTYIVNAELTHIETGVIYWTDENSEINKVVQQPKVKF